jgi:hypothetical protein
MHGARLFAAAAMTFVVSGVTIVLAALVMTFGPEVESDLWPVNGNFAVQSVTADGPDMIVVANLVKKRQCQFISPTLGEADGRFLDVKCVGPACGLSWPVSDEPRTVVWRIAGGAGREVALSQQHTCHPMWRTFSNLGKADGRVQK